MNASLHKRILEISFKHKLSHIGSCLTAVDIIEEVFSKKKSDEKFVLSSGHAGLGLYVVLEKYGYGAADTHMNCQGVHPDRISATTEIDWCSASVWHPHHGVDCSTGSLGQGLPIAVGMALADRKKHVYCLISDGECAEGSIWEALEIIHRQNVTNISIYVNANEWGAYDAVDSSRLRRKLSAFDTNSVVTFVRTDCRKYPFLKDLDAHYHVMTEEEYESAIESLK